MFIFLFKFENHKFTQNLIFKGIPTGDFGESVSAGRKISRKLKN